MRPTQLRFLTDENVSPRLVAFLRQQGYDVQDVKEEGWQGKDDVYILRKAWRFKRFVISHDRDFGKLVIEQGNPCYGVIYLRLKDQRASNTITVMKRFLKKRIVIKPGTLIVIQETRARIRLVPSQKSSKR